MPLIHPSMILLAGLAGGILIDATWAPTFLGWISAFLLSLAFWYPLKRTSPAAPLLVFVTVICASGLSSHIQREMRSENDLRSWVSTTRQIVHLEGRIASVPAVRSRQTLFTSPSSDEKYTRFELEASRLFEADRSIAIQGRLIVSIDAEMPELSPGMLVDLYGQLKRPDPPLNPTDFDYARFLDNHGFAGTLRVDHPAALSIVSRVPDTVWRRIQCFREASRAYLLKRLQAVMPPGTYPLAAALLLGAREDLDSETLSAFQNTGLMHLISISGLHLALIVGMFVIAIKMLPASPMQRQWLLIAVLLMYLFFVDLRPPVMRAGMLIVLWMFASLRLREPSLAHVLVLTTILLLLLDPASLFDVGAQLSFLCIYAISQSDRWYRAWKLHRQTLDDPEFAETTFWSGVIQKFEFGVLWIPLGILLITGPYLMSMFGQFSMMSLLLSVPISILLGLVLFFGMLTLVLLPLPSLFVAPVATLFSLSLAILQQLVIRLESLPWHLVYTSGLGEWWNIAYYLIWLIPLLFASNRRQLTVWHRRALTAGLCWIALGIMINTTTVWLRPHEVRVVFHAVGHGNATILMTPNGQAILVDAGSFYGSPYTVRSLRQTLTSLGISRLNAVVISHTDSDHYNLLPHLARTIPIDTLLISQASLKDQHRGLLALCDQVKRDGCEIRFVQAGDQIRVDPEVTLRVLHPTSEPSQWGESDNENSIVLDCLYRGRHLLLTGDIEDDGLDTLLQSDAPQPVELLVVPHHGARGSNPLSLGTWVKPRVALASTSKRISELPHLNETYPSSSLLSTAEGAVEVRWNEDGMTVEQFQDGTWRPIEISNDIIPKPHSTPTSH